MKGKTAAGIAPTKPVASRWFNLMTIISQSSLDIWVHREKDQLWWTTSRLDPPSFEAKVEPVGRKREVVVCHKPCDPWSDKNRKGNRLLWNAMHSKARDFLFTEGTLQQLSDDYAAYTLALIDGTDLSPWHSRIDWLSKEKNDRGKRGAGVVFNARERALARMAMTATATAAFAKGQEKIGIVKNKDLLFKSQQHLEQYLSKLLDTQEGLCALTCLRLQYDGDHTDSEMLCSLDRIDSNRHYEEGNLQIVCRFANRWKGSDNNDLFLRLIKEVRP